MRLSSLILILLSTLQILWGFVSHRVSHRVLFTQSHINSQANNQCEDTCESQKCEDGKNFSSFLLNLEKPISLEELADSNIVKIVNLECTDIQCNQLCWKCLGYIYDSEEAQFKLSDKVFPKWALKYPTPPDVIGVTRVYSDPAVDRLVRDANMNLMRSVPRDFKGGVKSLEKVGFKLYKLNELTPNKTRRAQLATWLIFYRDCLFGRSIEQLQAEAAERKRIATLETEAGEISPSETMYERKRLDTPVSEHD